MRQAGQDFATQVIRRHRAATSPSHDGDKQSRIRDLASAPGAAVEMLLQKGEQVVVDLVVDQQEDDLSDPYTVHRVSLVPAGLSIKRRLFC